MHTSLRWKELHIEENLATMRSDIRRELDSLRPENINDREKMNRWMDDIDQVERRITRIRTHLQPKVEHNLGYRFEDPDMFVIALFQPSTKNLFLEIETHFRGKTGNMTPLEVIREMADIPEAAKTLAWVGDAALHLAVLQEIWVDRVAGVGALTERRKDYVKNANLAKLSDHWDLFSHRIHFDLKEPVQEAEHVKGTLVESIYGIIFLQGGLRDVARAVHLIRPP
jgi:dsRNA-specific ribonuclease